MPSMVSSPPQVPEDPPRPLKPRDLFAEDSKGAAVSASLRATFITTKSTKSGEPWAVIDGVWRGRRLRCVVFPRAWATLQRPSPGDAVVVSGVLAYRDGQAIVWVRQMNVISPLSACDRYRADNDEEDAGRSGRSGFHST